MGTGTTSTTSLTDTTSHTSLAPTTTRTTTTRTTLAWAWLPATLPPEHVATTSAASTQAAASTTTTSAMQANAWLVNEVKRWNPGVEYRLQTSGFCFSILSKSECTSAAMANHAMGRRAIDTSCTEPDCAPRGCYVDVSADGYLAMYYNSLKLGECSQLHQCLCKDIGVTTDAQSSQRLQLLAAKIEASA